MKTTVLCLLFSFIMCHHISLCGTHYKLIASVPGFKSAIPGNNFTYGAGANSKFKIVNETDSEYRVMFYKIETYDKATAKVSSSMVDNNSSQNVRTVSEEEIYVISKTDLPNYYYTYSSGNIGGILTVPFKLINNGKLSPGATLGGFYGYKISTISLIISAGLSSIPTSDLNSKQVETKFGLTGAVGTVFEPIPKFQLGLIVGIDHLGSDWQYEDKGWVSLAVGFVFAQ